MSLSKQLMNIIGTVPSNKKIRKCPEVKVISIILKTSFAPNGMAASLFFFWQQIFMVLVGYLM